MPYQTRFPPACEKCGDSCTDPRHHPLIAQPWKTCNPEHATKCTYCPRRGVIQQGQEVIFRALCYIHMLMYCDLLGTSLQVHVESSDLLQRQIYETFGKYLPNTEEEAEDE